MEKERAKKGFSFNANSVIGGLHRAGTLKVFESVDENSELLKRLRAWKINKKDFEQQKFRQRVAETNVTLNDTSIKTMIIKLNAIEHLMKDLNKETKKVHGRVDAGENKI